MIISILTTLLIGALAGYVATRIMGSESSTMHNILLGILGSFVGGLVFSLLGLSATGFLGEVIVSIVGACICIWIARKIAK